MPTKLDAILWDKYALVITVCMGFKQHMPDKSFLLKCLADLPMYWHKNLDFGHLLEILELVISVIHSCYILAGPHGNKYIRNSKNTNC